MFNNNGVEMRPTTKNLVRKYGLHFMIWPSQAAWIYATVSNDNDFYKGIENKIQKLGTEPVRIQSSPFTSGRFLARLGRWLCVKI